MAAAASASPDGTTLFHQVQAQLERQLVESTIRRRERQRLDRIPDVDVPLFEFELARAAGRRQQRRQHEEALLDAASGHGQVRLSIPSPPPERRCSVRSWKALAAESAAANPTPPAADGAAGPRASAAVRRWADLFWLTCNRDRLHGVLQRDYCEMYVAVLKTLYESFDADKAGLIARRHFAQIVGSGERGLSREAMRRAMLDTAEVWVTSPTPDSYIDFFKKLFFRISVPRNGNEFRWRDLDAVPPSMDETRRPFNVDSLPDYTKLVGIVQPPPPNSSSSSSAATGRSAAARRLAPTPALSDHVQQAAPEPTSAALPPIRGASTAAAAAPPPVASKGRPSAGRIAAVQRGGGRSANPRPSVDDLDLLVGRRRRLLPNDVDDLIAVRDLVPDPAPAVIIVRNDAGRRRRQSRDTSWLEIRSTPLRGGARLPALAAL